MLSYAVITFNYRAVAQADIFWTAVSDIIVASVTYFTVGAIAKAKSRWESCGFVAGSVAGSILGILISKQVL